MQGRIVFATGSAGKIKEIRMIMEDTGLEVVSMKDAGIKADIEENGKTYEENALIKARAVAAFTKDIVMADDSGLEIDALNKEPGIYYVPEFGKTTAELTEEEKNQVSHRGKALELMKEELKKYEDTDRK